MELTQQETIVVVVIQLVITPKIELRLGGKLHGMAHIDLVPQVGLALGPHTLAHSLPKLEDIREVRLGWAQSD